MRNPYYPLRSSRKKVKDQIALRPITLDEAKALKYGDRLWLLDRKGEVVPVKVVSAVKRWKRQPDRIEFSVKFGFWETIRIDTSDIIKEYVLVEDNVLPGMEVI